MRDCRAVSFCDPVHDTALRRFEAALKDTMGWLTLNQHVDEAQYLAKETELTHALDTLSSELQPTNFDNENGNLPPMTGGGRERGERTGGDGGGGGPDMPQQKQNARRTAHSEAVALCTVVAGGGGRWRRRGAPATHATPQQPQHATRRTTYTRYP